MDNIQVWLALGVVLAVGLFLLQGWMSRKSGEKSTADPLAEAEVYIAYGRKTQALAMLEEALQKDPSRTDISARIRELAKQ